MAFDVENSLEQDARRALEARSYDVARDRIDDLIDRVIADPARADHVVQALARLTEVGAGSGPEGYSVVIWGLWGQVIVFKEAGRFAESLLKLEDLQSQKPSPVSTVDWPVRLEVTRLTLLYSLGRFEDILDVADARTEARPDDDLVDQELLVETLWLRRFAEHQVDTHNESGASLRDGIRKLLISDPNADTRASAAQATWFALWPAVVAHDAAAILDVTSELEDAFALELNEDTERFLGQKLIAAADWLWGYSGSFPEMLDRSLLISRTVLERYERSSNEADLSLLAEASWAEYKSLGTLGELGEQAGAVERLVQLGTVAADVLGEKISQLQDTEDGSYALTLAMMQAVALSGAEGQENEVIRLLDAAIADHRDDANASVQELLTRVRLIRSQLTD